MTSILIRNIDDAEAQKIRLSTDHRTFVDALQEVGVIKVRLTHKPHIDDPEEYYKDNLPTSLITEDDFIWLNTDTNSESKTVHVLSSVPFPAVPPPEMMDESLMPFRREQVKKYFVDGIRDTAQKRVDYFSRSIVKYNQYKDPSSAIPPEKIKEYAQAERDERFFTARYFIFLFERKDCQEKLKALLAQTFGDIPPFERGKKYPLSWDRLVEGASLKLEYDCPSPNDYTEYLSKNLPKRHFVPYVIKQGTRADGSFRKDLEGATQVDAYITSPAGLTILVEAKYLSDISVDVSYDVTRNQIARNIDVMMDKERGLFLLLTPQFFKERPHSRLYGYKMQDYQRDPHTLMADLNHRMELEPHQWKGITDRIAWITWKDLDDLGLNVNEERRKYRKNQNLKGDEL